MKSFKLLPLLILVSCGSATLAPQNQRIVKFNEKASGNKSAIYTSVLGYLAKNLGDSNSAIKMQDKDSGMIITKMNIDCNVLRQFGDVNGYYVQTNLTSKSEDNSLKLIFEDLVMVDKLGTPFKYDYGQITDQTKVEKIKECLIPVKDSILNSIN